MIKAFRRSIIIMKGGIVIYFDNAATSGVKPRSVINAVDHALKNLSANPGRGGHKTSVSAATGVFDVRKKLYEFFNAESENSVCFTANCTAAVNTVLFGCLHTGDHVIISSLEHNAVQRPLAALAQRLGISYDIASININEPDECVAEIEKLIRKNTKLIFVTHASNVTGTLLPIERIGKLCRERGILFGVDAAQSAGHIDIDMKQMCIDFLCIAPHKGLFAPMGTGVLIADKPIDEVLIKGGTGVNSLSPEQPDSLPERIESGTVNVPGIMGIGAGIDFVKKYGMNRSHRKINTMLRYFYLELRKMGALLYAPAPSLLNNAGVLSFNLHEKGSEEVAQFLASRSVAVRGGYHCAPLAHKTIGTLDTGTVRISPSVFNSFDEAEKTVFLLKKLKNNH